MNVNHCELRGVPTTLWTSIKILNRLDSSYPRLEARALPADLAVLPGCCSHSQCCGLRKVSSIYNTELLYKKDYFYLCYSTAVTAHHAHGGGTVAHTSRLLRQFNFKANSLLQCRYHQPLTLK
jgi:hypothetical protein